MKNKFLATLFLACSISTVSAQTPVYMDDAQPIEARVKDALSRMTLEEKVALCHAQSKFSSAGVPRLGIPELWMSDGLTVSVPKSTGMTGDMPTGPMTALPLSRL